MFAKEDSLPKVPRAPSQGTGLPLPLSMHRHAKKTVREFSLASYERDLLLILPPKKVLHNLPLHSLEAFHF